MSNTIKKGPGHLPKEQKKAPLGKWFLSNLLRLNNFPFGKDRNRDVLLTTVSNHKGDPQTLYFDKLSSGQNDERSDATGDASRNSAWSIKIFLN